MRSNMTRIVRVTAFSVLAAFFLSLSAPAVADASTPADLISAEPEFIALPVPAPGHAQVAETSITNIAHEEVEVLLDVSAPRDDVLSRSGSPLTFQLEIDGVVQGAPAAIATLTDGPVVIGTLAPGERIEVRSVIAMARDASNEYAGLSSEALLRFTAQADSRSDQGSLAITGAAAPFVIALIAVVLIGGGIVLVRARRRVNTAEGEGNE